MSRPLSILIKFIECIKIALIIVIGFASLFAQKLKITQTQKPEPEGFFLVYISIFGVGIVLAAVIFGLLSRRKTDVQD